MRIEKQDNTSPSRALSSISWDTLPEELWMRIFTFCAPLQLIKASSVNRQFYRLVYDPAFDLLSQRLYYAAAHIFHFGYVSRIDHVAYAPKTGTMAWMHQERQPQISLLWIGNVSSLVGSPQDIGSDNAPLVEKSLDLAGNDFGSYLKGSDPEQAFWLKIDDLTSSKLALPQNLEKKRAHSGWGWSNLLNDKIAAFTPMEEILIFEKGSQIHLIPAIENARPTHLHLQQAGEEEYLAVLYMVYEKNQRNICRYSCKDGSLIDSYTTPLQNLSRFHEFLSDESRCALFWPQFQHDPTRFIEIFDLRSKQTLEIQVSGYEQIHLHKGKLVVISPNCSVAVYDASTGDILRTIDAGLSPESSFKHNKAYSAVSNNKIAIAACRESFVSLFDLNTGKKLCTFQVGQATHEYITSLAFDNSDPKHSFLAVGLSQGTVVVFPASLREGAEKSNPPLGFKAFCADEGPPDFFVENLEDPPWAHWTCIDCLFDCCIAINNFFKMIWSSL
jgi:hypothetical protein